MEDLVLRDILEEEGIKLTEDQQNAFDSIKRGKHTLIIGRPGVGKSMLIGVLKKYFGNKMVVGSTTGISNQRLFNGQGGIGSMHRIFSLPTRMHTTGDRKRLLPFAQANLANNKDVEYILIDEAGFILNADLLELIYHRIQRFNRKNKYHGARNIKLILIADLLQLPVFFSKTEENYMQQMYGSPFFFKSYRFESMDFTLGFINEVMRTKNKVFQQALDVMRYGQEERYEKLCQWVNRVMYKTHIPEGLPLISCWNREAEKINDYELSKNQNELWEYFAEVSGEYNIEDCLASETVQVKVGALVMTLINDQYDEYSNGSIGRVTNCTTDGIWVNMNHSHRDVFVPIHTFEQLDTEEDGHTVMKDGTKRPKLKHKLAGTCKQLPIRLAHAMSIHKSQGATIDSPCVVDLGKNGFYRSTGFGEALAYVALSRFTDPNLVYLKYPLKPEHIKVNREILQWVLENGGK